MISRVLLTKKHYPKPFPDKLIYKRRNLPTPSRQEEFILIDEQGKMAGELICHKSSYPNWREDYHGDTLLIDFIKSNDYNKYNGTYLLNFAKNYSKHSGCNGYILLKADSSFTPNRVPHLFYRKNEFSSLDKRIDAFLDKFIKAKKDAKHTDVPNILMFYPGKKNDKKNGFIEKIKNIIKLSY